MVTRLILCFDGTWNRPDNSTNLAARVETNVVRFYEAVKNGPLPDGSVQNKWYDTGVGTDWYDRVVGGAFGFGLDQKIRDGYQWLVDTYPWPDPGDQQVFVLGFSRGAYTARSLVGMIRNVGLLLPENAHRVADAYAAYRNRDPSADTAQAVAFRERFSRPVKIKFLGVWDTVGALGIPLSALQWLNAQEYAFHDTELSGIVETAAQALAINEHRIDYQAALWQPIAKPGQMVEQRWFAGAHADVGGGYNSRRLSDLSLAWMLAKAAAAGLVTQPADTPTLSDVNCLEAINDSYRDFLAGAYADTHPPYYRPMTLGGDSTQALDPSVLRRRELDPTYQPPNPGFPAG